MKSFGVLLDLLFCLVMSGGLFLLGMVCGGSPGLHMPLIAAAGAVLYSASFGRWIRPLVGRGEEYTRRRLKALKNHIKKWNKNLKNIFSRLKKRFTITKYTKNDNVGRYVSKSGAMRARRKGEHDEIPQGRHTGKTYYPSSSGLCSFHDG